MRSGAQQLFAQAPKVEVAEPLVTCADQRDEKGDAHVVLSSHSPARGIQTGIGLVTVPKVSSRQCKPVTFHRHWSPVCTQDGSARSRVPWLYLKEISTGKMQLALQALVDLKAKGLSCECRIPPGQVDLE